MVGLWSESDDFPRLLAGAGSRQIEGHARGEHSAERLADDDPRSRRRSIDGPIRPIPSPANDNVARGVDDFGRFEREARRSARQTSFARGDMTRKQWGLVRFEHVQCRPRARIDLYEPDGLG